MDVDAPKETTTEANKTVDGPEVDVKGDGGVMKKILKAGSGWEKPSSGSDVEVHYTGTLLDGTKFDSSKDRDKTFKFQLGSGSVIKGWDAVVATMELGEICKVTLKPEYAYGARGSPPSIPPNATLVFEIELISFSNEKDLTDDGGVMKKVLSVSGTENLNPSYETSCKFHVKCYDSQGTVYFESDQELTIGESEIPKGLQKALESMKKGEKSSFKVKAKYGYGSEGNAEKKIPPNKDLIYDIELFDFKKGRETWELTNFSEKFSFALKRKTDGNSFYEKNIIDLATEKYKKSLDVFDYDSDLKDEEKEKVKKEIKLPCQLNLAACHQKKNELMKVIEYSNKALEIDAKSVKALWRRGVALTETGEYIDAKRDLNEALTHDPNNKAVKAAIVKLKKAMEDQDKKDKQRFKNMFQRMSKLEEKETQLSDGKPKDQGASDGNSNDSKQNPSSSTHYASSDSDKKPAGENTTKNT